MKAILNEISIPTIFNAGHINDCAENLLSGFVYLSEKKIGDSQLKLHLTSDFEVSPFGSAFMNRIYSNYDWEIHALFSGLIDCPKVQDLVQLHEANKAPYLKVTTNFNNNEVSGIGLKAITYSSNELSIMYSLSSHNDWEKSKIDLKAFSNPDSFVRKQALNFSKEDSPEAELFFFQTVIKHLELINWNPAVINFPFSSIAKNAYKAKCLEEIGNCNLANDKIPVYRKYGKLFCLTNGYQFDAELSAINTNGGQIRDIYSAGSGNKTRFISIDIENGGFEFCDFDRTHLGTYGWDGNLIGEAKPNTHSIKLTR